MKKLILLFGLFAIVGSFNLVQASVVTNDVIELYDCDKCQNHECDQACKKEGCTAKKACGKDHAACKKGETKACCKKDASAMAAKTEAKSCCKKGANASCAKKKEAEPKK